MKRDFLKTGGEDLRAKHSDVVCDFHDEYFYGGFIVKEDIWSELSKKLGIHKEDKSRSVVYKANYPFIALI